MQGCSRHAWPNGLASEPVQVWRVQQQHPPPQQSQQQQQQQQLEPSLHCCPGRSSAGGRDLRASSILAQPTDAADADTMAAAEAQPAAQCTDSSGDRIAAAWLQSTQLEAPSPAPMMQQALPAPLQQQPHGPAAGQDSAASVDLPLPVQAAWPPSRQSGMPVEAEPAQHAAAPCHGQPPAHAAAAAGALSSCSYGSAGSGPNASSMADRGSAHSSASGCSSLAHGQSEHQDALLRATRLRHAAAALAARQQRALIRAQQAGEN